jgi:uncharacterized protein YxjI
MLEADKFAVKEQVKFLKSSQSYEIFDGDSGELIGTAQEVIGGLNKMLRWVISKALMPTRFEIREKPDDALLFVICRGAYIFRSRVEVLNADGELIGFFRSKILTIGGGFHVYDRDGKHFAEVKGNLIGFNYRIRTPDKEVELGTVKKKWGGMARELFSSADSYLVDISDELRDQPVAKMLTLATALAIDMIFKSESRGGIGGFGGE